MRGITQKRTLLACLKPGRLSKARPVSRHQEVPSHGDPATDCDSRHGLSAVDALDPCLDDFLRDVIDVVDMHRGKACSFVVIVKVLFCGDVSEGADLCCEMGHYCQPFASGCQARCPQTCEEINQRNAFTSGALGPGRKSGFVWLPSGFGDGRDSRLRGLLLGGLLRCRAWRSRQWNQSPFPRKG